MKNIVFCLIQSDMRKESQSSNNTMSGRIDFFLDFLLQKRKEKWKQIVERIVNEQQPNKPIAGQINSFKIFFFFAFALFFDSIRFRVHFILKLVATYVEEKVRLILNAVIAFDCGRFTFRITNNFVYIFIACTLPTAEENCFDVEATATVNAQLATGNRITYRLSCWCGVLRIDRIERRESKKRKRHSIPDPVAIQWLMTHALSPHKLLINRRCISVTDQTDRWTYTAHTDQWGPQQNISFQRKD